MRRSGLCADRAQCEAFGQVWLDVRGERGNIIGDRRGWFSGPGETRRTEAIPMRDPKQVAMTGPLSGYRDGFADELAATRYTPGSAEHQVGLMAHLSRWLE